MWNPFKMLRTKDWIKLKSSWLYIFNLMIRDHIESMGVDLLGIGVPRLACLRLAAWLEWWPSTTHLHQRKAQDPHEGPSLAGQTTRSFLRRGLVRLAHEEAERSRQGTSRGARDASHDDRNQAGASACNVLVSSLVLWRPAQAKSTEASCKGCYIGATRPRPEDGKAEVIVEPKTASP